jgi:NAD(P)H-quinone oxidoreductase subunit 5
VCALLHAGFVNAGGIAALKFAPLFTAAPLALFALLAGGVAAILGGTAIGLVRADVKGRLAGSTVAQMGYMLVQCGLGAFAHALFHILAHGVFKAHAFLRANGEIGVPANTASAPARGTEWLMLLPSLLFFAAWGLTDLALADLVLLSFGATLGIEALSLAWRRGCLPQGVLRGLAATIPALLAVVFVHHLLPPAVAAPLPIAPSAHLLGAMLGVLSILAYLRAARVALPDALHAALLRLASAHPAQRARLAPLPLATLRAARRPS